jgi:hypothetical protein
LCRGGRLGNAETLASDAAGEFVYGVQMPLQMVLSAHGPSEGLHETQHVHLLWADRRPAALATRKFGAYEAVRPAT